MKGLCCFLVICSCVCIVGKVSATGYLTYSFDDGHITTYTNAYPILAAHGQVGTANPVLDRILSGYSWCMNVQQLLELEAAGWEICSHSVTHPGMRSLPLTYADETLVAPNSAERELEMSKTGFIDFGLNVQNFVVPGSTWNDDLAILSTSYYNSVVTGGRSGNTMPLENRWSIQRKNVFTNDTVSDVTTLIERELNNNKWLILIFHQIIESEDGGWEPWSESKLEELATWVEDHGISVVTQQQGLELSNALIDLTAEPELTIQAEDYDEGGQHVAYFDTTPGNKGGQYRNDDVDIWLDNPNTYYTGSSATNEWLNYTIDVPFSGNYRLDIRVATPNSNRRAHVEYDDVDKTGSLTVPNTGGWTTWQTMSTNVDLSAGQQVMRLFIEYGGLNIDQISLVYTDDADGDFDFDGDGDVDGLDIKEFIKAFGSSSNDQNYNLNADFNNDDEVNDEDLSYFALNFGQTY